MEEKIVRTVCRMCAAGCGMNVSVKEGKIVKVCGLPEDPRTKGALCAKGLSATQLVHNPDRLRYPMERMAGRGEGKWRRISWQQALDTIGTKLEKIKQRDGAQAISVFRSQASDWGTAWQYPIRFMNLLGSPNLITPGSQCFYPRRIAGVSTYGVRTSPDYENASCIILWASNPPGCAEDGLRVGQILEAQEKGARLIVVDPILTPMAAKADIWAQIRPGTDCALALAMLNVIINEELYDKEFTNEWTYGFDKLREHVHKYPPDEVEKITFIGAGTIKEIARAYAKGRPACLYDGNGIDQQFNSVQTARALCILRSITGNLDIPGGEWIPNTLELTDARLMDKMPKDVKPAGDYPLMFQYRHLPPQPIIDAILTGEPYPIKAMIVQGGNPAVTLPNTAKVREALSSLELLVVMDLFMTRTAELSDIVLPAASSFEKTNLTVYPSVRTNFVLLQQKVIEPIGESWPDWKLWFELGKKMGYYKEFPWEDVEEALDEQLKPSGLTVAYLKEKPVQLPKRYEKFKENGFLQVPSGKVQLYSELLHRYGFEPLPTYIEPPESPVSTPELLNTYPLMAVCWPRSLYVHSQFRNIPWLRHLDPEPLVRIHPSDAEERGIKDDNKVVVTSLRGSINTKAMISERVPRGTVALSWGWGEAMPEAGLNRLTDDMSRNRIAGSTSNRLFLCEVEKT